MAADGGSGPTHGHFFIKKTFHKLAYCHHCTEFLWGPIQQGYVCEVCNFVVHERCMKTVVNHCSSIAAQLVKTPVPHCWSDQLHLKRKFCNVCRKRLDDTWAVRCEICDYHVHADCQDLAVANCKPCSVFIPERKLSDLVHAHHWLEGNLQINSKCIICKRSCYSTECLAGLRCQWCGINVHSSCWHRIPSECNYGLVEPIMLPPQAVSVPRTEVPMEAILGIQPRRKDPISPPRTISEDFTSDTRTIGEDGCSSKEKGSSKEKQEDKDEEIIKVFDGNLSLRRRLFRTITIPKNSNVEQFLAACLKANHIHRNPLCYYLSDAYEADDTPLSDPSPVAQITRKEGKRPAVFLRFRESNDAGTITIYPSQLHQVTDPITINVKSHTKVRDSIREAINLFDLPDKNVDNYQLSEIVLDKGVVERVMTEDERPWELLKAASRDSIRQMELTRFYLQQKEDPHGSNIALYIANLPLNLKQRQYENILNEFLGEDNKFLQIGPIYYEYGSLVITYASANKAVRAMYTLREASVEDKSLLVLLLPTIVPQMTPPKVRPLLVFVNVKSGGCQGLELIGSFRKLLNPYQVYDLDNGGPLPGLWVFRHVQDYRILVCGGDGTIGWVLQCLDNVGQDSECSSPPCAIVPLGTGNDLARVLHWGPGYTGGEDPLSVLRDVIDAEEIRLDRWTVVFYNEDKVQEERPIPKAIGAQLPPGATNEDNTQIFVMNNYFGIGIDADLCLDFHNAREENPNKFNSRLHNKGVYVKMGLRKMMNSRKLCKDLHRKIRLEVDNKHVELPPLEGIIILNILSWGSGANPWGPEKEDNFSKPNHWDGMLEVMGVTGVVHLGQIQSGLRSAIRIAQGAHIKIKLIHEVPVQVDGEPWIQGAGEVVVLKSALKATMLKKIKMKRRNTETSIPQHDADEGPPC